MNNFSLLLFLFVSCLCVWLCSSSRMLEATNEFDVMKYGAVGDGKTDDSSAFLKTWGAACSSPGQLQTIVVPSQKTFMLKPIVFKGPCKSESVHFQIQGTLIAPGTTWNIDSQKSWIQFTNINGLIMDGGGTINGQGSVWWNSCGNTGATCRNVPRPDALIFNKMDQLKLSGLTHIDSPRAHIGINNCKNVDAFKLNIYAPQNSPNTDGFDISQSSNINIYDSSIQTGDDCFAMNTGSSYINISNVYCGPGHGISVGSLGKNGEYATVEEVYVSNCTLDGTTNGLRIKTFPEGSGYVRQIHFWDIILKNAANPIIIDQFYANKLYSTENVKGNGQGIKISDVSYSNVRGTSATKDAITLNCAQSFGCTNIMMDNIQITPGPSSPAVYSTCQNAHVKAIESSPKVPCV